MRQTGQGQKGDRVGRYKKICKGDNTTKRRDRERKNTGQRETETGSWNMRTDK